MITTNQREWQKEGVYFPAKPRLLVTDNQSRVGMWWWFVPPGAAITAIQAVGLNPGQVLHKFPHQLSSGQLQRLLIARDNPLHPYSRMLMASVPRLHKKWEEVTLAEAEVELPAGVAYYEAPPVTNENGDRARVEPALIEVEPDHFVACTQRSL